MTCFRFVLVAEMTNSFELLEDVGVIFGHTVKNQKSGLILKSKILFQILTLFR
jgi:hypothetical protein